MITLTIHGTDGMRQASSDLLKSIGNEISRQQRTVTAQTLEAIRKRLSVWSGQTQNSITVSHGNRVVKMARRNWAECNLMWRTHGGGSTNDVATGQNLERKADYGRYVTLLGAIRPDKPWGDIWITADSRAGRNGLWLGYAPKGLYRHLEMRRCGVRFKPRMARTALEEIINEGAKGTIFRPIP